MEKRAAPTPESIMQLGFGFMASKTLLSAIELGIFTLLATGPLDAKALTQKLKLNPRAACDFFDTLVALRMLNRQDGLYSNTPETDIFLDAAKPSYIGGLLEMANARLFGFWGSLTEALRTGQPQNEAKAGGDIFAALYSSPARLEGFLKAMTGISLGAAQAIAQKFPWKEYKTFVDIGAAQGGLPVQIALANKHLTGTGYDLPVVQPIFEKYIRSHQLENRIRFQAGDFFKDALPSADVIVMGHILHDWNLEDKKMLLAKAHKALPTGGALIVYESLIDDNRSESVNGLLMSLNMLIETTGGFDYTGADCTGWMREAGFRQTRVEHLAGPDSMVIGIK
ncbi:MAG: O-methyltransferase family 2 [Pedosphaera sp.]|nr:O-methyltransferase family 2 [Pedosphaera sp.]